MLLEAARKEIMSKKEKALKRQLLALLRDDGKGHHNEKFANRLEDFTVKIVPLSVNPKFTAAITFDEALIQISEGFLQDKETFHQLNVLMRHELAHNLMMHQIRCRNKLINKYGKEGATHFERSQSLHDLMNVIEDFEISNKVYSDADKLVVKFMKNNGEIIGGLITEVNKPGWENMSLEQMDDALEQEINRLHQNILQAWSTHSNDPLKNDQGIITNDAANAYYYADAQRDDNFLGEVEDFVNNKIGYHLFPYDQKQGRPVVAAFKHLPEEWQKVISDTYNEFKDSKYTEKDFDSRIADICNSQLRNPIQIKDDKNKVITTAYSPEEKLFVGDILKNLKYSLQQKANWLDNVKKVLSDPQFTNDDLQDLRKGL